MSRRGFCLKPSPFLPFHLSRNPSLSHTTYGFIPAGYSKDKVLYSDVDLGVDMDSRVAIVGPNGTGKSTLLKLMTGDLEPLDGMVKR
jgi:ATPase subunit of ABC transporter with duplicated ATPase domains